MTLEQLNGLPDDDAAHWFEYCCAAPSWIEKMVAERQYKDMDSLHHHAESAWLQCGEQDYLKAFEAHPMIGDLHTLRAKYAHTAADAASEQQGTRRASDELLQALHKANHEYLDKFGFIFIICATGLTAESMLNSLEQRLPNTRQQEIANAATEQLKITQLRLAKQLNTKNKKGNPS